jgi:WD40 repeat protein
MWDVWVRPLGMIGQLTILRWHACRQQRKSKAHTKYQYTSTSLTCGSHLITASLDKTVRCWGLSDGSTLWVASHDSPVLVLAVGNGVCCSGTKENKVACRDLQQGVLQWEEDIEEVTALDVQEGAVLAGSREGKLSCLHMNHTGRGIRPLGYRARPSWPHTDPSP